MSALSKIFELNFTDIVVLFYDYSKVVILICKQPMKLPKWGTFLWMLD